MSLWASLRRRLSGQSSDAVAAMGRARDLEREGRLEAASSAFEDAGDLDEALRVLLLEIDVAADPRDRVALLSRALGLATRAQEDLLPIRRRLALARLNLAREQPAATRSAGDLRVLAEELLSLDEADDAADALLLIGDHTRAASILERAGRIERLEEVLDRAREEQRDRRTRSEAHARLAALESSGQRVDALKLATELSERPDDEDAQRAVHRLRNLLSTSDTIVLEHGDERARWLVRDRVIVGRADADIALASPVLSRQHLELSRDGGGTPTVRDLQTRNGTMIAGARLEATLALDVSRTLSMGGAIPIGLSPHPTSGGVRIEVAGRVYIASLGPARLGPWALERHASSLRLVAPPGAPPPILSNDIAAPEGVDLCVGDEIRAERSGPVVLRVRDDR